MTVEAAGSDVETTGSGAGMRRPGRALRKTLGRHRRALGAALVLSVVGAALSIAQPLVVNRVVDRIAVGSVWFEVCVLTALVVAGTLVGATQQFVLACTAEAAVLSIRRDLIDRLTRLPIRMYDTHRRGDLVSRLGADTSLVQAAFTGGVVDAVSGVLVVLGSIVAMALLDPLMLGIVVAVILVAGCSIVIASARVQHVTVASQTAVGTMSADMERALSAIRTVRALGAERRIGTELHDSAQEVYRLGVRAARVEALLWPVSGLATQVAFLAVLGIGGARVASGALSVGELVSFVLYLFMMAMPLAQAVAAVTSVRSALGGMERIGGVLDVPAEAGIDGEDSAGGEAAVTGGGVTFENVSFGYDADRPTLAEVSFTAAAGTTTAIVGPSGSGKSTLLALLEQFYDLDSGRILLGGVDVRDVGRRASRSRIAYVEQEAPVLSGTVRDNLALGGESSDEEYWSALESVDLAVRFRRGDGLDTVLGDHGILLSGGERQRLALARVLLLDTPVLVLDEPTASVDSRNEHLIQEAIRTTGAGRTVIVVAHRLSTVTSADQIVVLDGGRVVEVGRHEELLESSELYRDLARRQHLVG